LVFFKLLICTMVSLVKGPFSTCLWWPLHLDNWYLSFCIGHGGDSHAVPVLLVRVNIVYIIYESFHEKEDKSVTCSIKFQKTLNWIFFPYFLTGESSFTWDTRKDNFFWNERAMDNLIGSPKCVTDVMLTK
jgi:hypothetical protein